MFFKIKPTCKAVLHVRQGGPGGMIIISHECALDKGHPDLHCSKMGAKWATHDKINERIEWEGRSL